MNESNANMTNEPTEHQVHYDFSALSPGFAKASEAMHSVYDRLTPEKAEIVRMMTHMFNTAYLSYTALENRSAESNQRVILAGIYADTFNRQLEYLRTLVKDKDNNELTEMMQSTSNWLERHNWIHIYPYTDMEGAVHYPTAAGIVRDMGLNSKMFHQFCRETHETGKDAPSRRSNGSDGKSIGQIAERICDRSRRFGEGVAA